MDLLSDLEEMLDPDEHGTQFIFNGVTYSGIFNDEFVVQDGASVGVESSIPVLYTSASVLNRGDEISLSSVLYEVQSVQPDGTGLFAVELDLA